MEERHGDGVAVSAPEIVKLLAHRYSDRSRYVTATEVADPSGRRHVDFVAACCWASDAYMIHAFELKVSKADMRRELSDPSKHNVFFDEIDTYSLVAPGDVLDDMEIIPRKWGVYSVVRNADGGLALKTVRKPLALHDEHVSERKIGRVFFAGLARAVSIRSAGMASALADAMSAREKVREDVEREIAGGAKVVPAWEWERVSALADKARRLGIASWAFSDDEMLRLRDAKHVVDCGVRVMHELTRVKSIINEAISSARYLFAGRNGACGAAEEAGSEV